MFNLKKKKGFTMMEVILVMGIIGVIAAATIPIMVAKTSKEQAVANLQKANSTLTSIANYAQSTGAMIDTWNYNATTTAFTESYIIPGLSVAENCGTGAGQGCFASSYKFANGAESDIDGDATYYKVVLTDGNSLAIKPFSGCMSNMGSQCVSFVVDINGPREPNIWGKDVFEYEITAGSASVVPYGTFVRDSYNPVTKQLNRETAENVNTQCSTGTGRYCALKIINDGWQITYY